LRQYDNTTPKFLSPSAKNHQSFIKCLECELIALGVTAKSSCE